MKQTANKGYILIYRSILDNLLWNSDEPFSRRDAWIDLILRANHRPKKVVIDGESITIKRGQLWNSQRALATRFRWSLGKLRRYIDLLKNEGMVEARGTKNGTLLTIVKYGVFQGKRNADSNADGNPDGNSDGNQTNNGEIMVIHEKKKKSAPLILPDGRIFQ